MSNRIDKIVSRRQAAEAKGSVNRDEVSISKLLLSAHLLSPVPMLLLPVQLLSPVLTLLSQMHLPSLEPRLLSSVLLSYSLPVKFFVADAYVIFAGGAVVAGANINVACAAAIAECRCFCRHCCLYRCCLRM